MLDFRLFRFAAVGLVNTLLGLSVIVAAKAWIGLGDVAANVLGYAIGLLAGFAANRRWTFEDTSAWGSALTRYVLVLIAAYSANLATTMFTIHRLGLNSYAAQTLGVLPYALVSYVGSRCFTFSGGAKI